MTDKMREEFEAAYARGEFYADEQDSEVKFQDFRKHCAYVAFNRGWKASRESLMIPHFCCYKFEGCQYYDADSVDEALEDMGLKVKP